MAAWFENLNLNSIKSISFSLKAPEYASDDYANETNPFACSDFIVADSNAMVAKLKSRIFEAIDKKSDSSETLMYGLKSRIQAIAVHPKKPILAIAGFEGFVILYDYEKKVESSNYECFTQGSRANDKRAADKESVQFCVMEFTPDGTELLIGQSNGYIKVMDPLTTRFKKMTGHQELKVSYENYPRIRHLVVSEDGLNFATSDSNQGVAIFKKDAKEGEWKFSGKIRSHDIEITGLCFGQSIDEQDQIQQRLFSIGADRRCFEYNVKDAKMTSSLPVLHDFMVELESKPTSLIWYPNIDFNEGLILTTNDEYKMKLWNPKLGNSRRTALGPTYGGEICKLKLLNSSSNTDGKYLVYSTNKKVIGLIKLPMDGNPNKTMGLIAHPDEVSDIAVSADGKYVFTCGGDDLAVNMWSVNVSPIEQAIAMGGEGIEPFINLIEGGRQGQTFQDMNDFFFYSIIRDRKENTTKTRKLDSKKVHVRELPNLMRAMGYYPTEQEVKNIIDEVKFSQFTELAVPKDNVSLEEFIRLFVNHRPVYGIGKNNIEEAFQTLCDATAANNSIPRTDFTTMLFQEGEQMNMQSLEKDLLQLIGEQNVQHALPTEITAEAFAENILGFEEVDEAEMLNENEQQSMQQTQSV